MTPCRAVDSTGIKVEGEGEWHARKHGGPKRRVWRKIHLGIDEETLKVRAVEITGSNVGDAPVLPDLLNQIPTHEQIGSVTADGAYDTRKCHDAIADRGAHAVIPPRRSARHCPRTNGGQRLAAERRPARLQIPRQSLVGPLSAASSGCACRTVDGADTTAGAASRQRCAVSNCSAGGSRQGTSIARLRSSRSVSPCSTAIPRLTHPLRKPWDNSVRERGTSAITRFVQQSP